LPSRICLESNDQFICERWRKVSVLESKKGAVRKVPSITEGRIAFQVEEETIITKAMDEEQRQLEA
jgi:hypothetical protein